MSDVHSNNRGRRAALLFLLASCRKGNFGRVRAISLAAVGLLVAAAVLPAAQSGEKMKRVPPRELLRSVHSTYTIYQAEKEIGSEKVVRRDYSDNTVDFRSTLEMHMPQGADISTESELMLQEESFFPMRYRSNRHVKQESVEINNSTEVEWYSNVAVVRKDTGSEEKTSRIVLPAGAAVIDMNEVYVFYQILFWYDASAGGTQNFNVFEPASGFVSSASLRQLDTETVTLEGEDIEASRYAFTRETADATLFVDADGRLLKVDQGYLVYELAEWSETAGPDE